MSRILSLIRLIPKVLFKIWSQGITRTLDIVRRRLRDEYRDWQLEIRTSGRIDRLKLGNNSSGRDYIATDYQCLDTLFEYLNPDLNNDVFLDYGCGKGRVIAVAAMYPFRRVTGVEYSAALCEIAEQNIQRASKQFKCQDVEIINADAGQYKLPNDVSLIFLFNPFGEDVLDRVHLRIGESLKQAPRRLRLIYAFPANKADYFTASNCLQMTAELPTARWEKFRLRVYENLPSEVVG